MAAILRNLECHDASLLVATEGHNVNVYKSGRNIAKVKVQSAEDLNALEVLSARRLLVTKGALDALRKKAASVTKGAAAEESTDSSTASDA